jgi:hypothetical protein
MRYAWLLVGVLGCGGWTKRDTALELVAVASLAEDWHQTQRCVDAEYCYERNPIIGDRGQNLSPGNYFLGVGMLHVAIAAVLPHGWIRTSFQAVTTAAEAKQVYDNVEEFGRFRMPLF